MRPRQPCAYCRRTITLSVAPLASITVSRTKPGPSGAKKRSSPTGVLDWQAIDQHGQWAGAALRLDRDRLGRAVAPRGEFQPRAVGRKQDAQRRILRCSLRPETLQWWRQFRRGSHDRTNGRRRQRPRQMPGAGERLEQDRRGVVAAHAAGGERAVRTPDPHADRVVARVADRPRVAEAERGAGLVGDRLRVAAVAGGEEARRRRRVEQDPGDVEGGLLRHQRLEHAWRDGIAAEPQRRSPAVTGQVGVKRHQPFQADPDAAERDRQAGQLRLARECTASRRIPTAAARSVCGPTRSSSATAGMLSEVCKASRALTGPEMAVEILRRVVAEAQRPIRHHGFRMRREVV